MIEVSKSKKALVAIQDLIIRVRTFAYEKKDYSEIAELLDDIEYLPALIVEEVNNTELFENYLANTCSKFGFNDIIQKYQSKTSL